jgi:hypothetical protein
VDTVASDSGVRLDKRVSKISTQHGEWPLRAGQTHSNVIARQFPDVLSNILARNMLRLLLKE